MRLALTNQDLSGQTIKGLPFSYIGNCRGSDIKWIGDWTHVSHYHNDFLRPDWSGAKTRYSYSRFDKFIDAVTSEDMNTDDHDMLLAAIRESLPKLEGVGKWAMAKAGRLLHDDIEQGLYLISWAIVAPIFLEVFEGDFRAAIETVKTGFGDKGQLIKRWSGSSAGASLDPCWAESPPPDLSAEGVATNAWGIVAQDFSGKRKYRKHWSELPVPTNPHDRLEMAELIEAEVEKAIGHPVTLYIVSIHSWSAYAAWGRVPRDWPMRSD